MFLKVAIVSWNAAPLVDTQIASGIGGTETFSWLLATELAARPERSVTFVVRHSHRLSSPPVSHLTVETVVEPLQSIRRNVRQAVSTSRRFPWVRLRKLDPALLWQVPLIAVAKLCRRKSPIQQLESQLRQISTDAWVVLGCSEESAATIRIARETGTPCILWIRSNGDLDERLFADSEFTNQYGVKGRTVLEAIQQATEVICQTRWQQKQLQRLTNRMGLVIPNPVDLKKWSVGIRGRLDRNHVLWVGRYDTFHKRPELCLELARRLSEIPFVMIINRGDPDTERQIRENAPENVTIIDFVPADEMPRWFAEARLFLSTGSNQHEGFPNVLLEASAAGVPIVAYEDFDGFLSQSQAGRCAHQQFDNLVTQVNELWTDDDSWKACAAAGQEYVKREHSVSKIFEEFDHQLARLTSSRDSDSTRD